MYYENLKNDISFTLFVKDQTQYINDENDFVHNNITKLIREMWITLG